MSRSALLQIENRVRRHLDNFFEGNSAPGFVLGVSGGPDSMALMYIFRQLGVNATVVHVNYQKRAGESEKDQALVEEMAGMWGYDCHSVRIEPGQSEGHNFQHWARNRRYRLFREFMSEYRQDGIAVAHHRHDQIETILQKLFRGAGLESWQGMKVWDGELFRPLLEIGRDDILKYVKDREVPYRTDESNLESDFARNLLRNEWLLKLEQYFPGWEQNVLNLPEHARLFGKALRQMAGGLVREGRRIDRSGFMDLDSDLQRALVLHVIKELDPGVEVSAKALSRLDELPSLQTGQSIQFNSRWSLVRDREWLQLDAEGGGEIIERSLGREELEKDAVRFEGMAFSIGDFSNPDYRHALYLDTASFAFPLKVRRWSEGDSFQPLGMKGHQKVADHLTHRKISAVHKEKSNVLESEEGLLAAVLFPPVDGNGPPGTISDLVKCGTGTRECLVIRRVQCEK